MVNSEDIKKIIEALVLRKSATQISFSSGDGGDCQEICTDFIKAVDKMMMSKFHYGLSSYTVDIVPEGNGATIYFFQSAPVNKISEDSM